MERMMNQLKYSVMADHGFFGMLNYLSENPDPINQAYALWILHEMQKCGTMVTPREFQHVLFKLGFVAPAMLGLAIATEDGIIESDEEEKD